MKHLKDFCGFIGLCKDCGGRVLDFTCNEPLIELRPEAVHWDWWMLCENEECKNHYGAGYFQGFPKWREPYV